VGDIEHPTVRCDLCGRELTALELGRNWPVAVLNGRTRETEDRCPDCFGPDARCPHCGELVDADDDDECPVCGGEFPTVR